MRIAPFILVGWVMAFSYTYAMMYEPEQAGYTKQERAEMDALVKKVSAKPRVKKVMTDEERNRVLNDLFGG